MRNKKMLLAILGGIMLLSLTACGHGNNQQGSMTSDEQPNSTVEDTTNDNTTGSTTPDEADIYLDDNANIIGSDLRAKIDLYNANWKNITGEVVALTIVDTPSTSIDAEATRVRENLGLSDKDSVLCVTTSGDSFLSIGSESKLNEAGITLNLDNSLPLADAIASKYEEMNTFYMNSETSSNEATGSSGTSSTSTDWSTDAKNIYNNFEDVAAKNGLIAIDVSDLNQEVYPGASVWQASNGTISFLMVSGEDDASDYFWYYYYDMLINGAAKGTFTQKYVPSDLSQPRSVSGTLDEDSVEPSTTTENPQVYFRCDKVGNVAICGSSTSADDASTIDDIFSQLGIPENNNIVY